jgi:hypothetical protein
MRQSRVALIFLGIGALLAIATIVRIATTSHPTSVRSPQARLEPLTEALSGQLHAQEHKRKTTRQLREELQAKKIISLEAAVHHLELENVEANTERRDVKVALAQALKEKSSTTIDVPALIGAIASLLAILVGAGNLFIKARRTAA